MADFRLADKDHCPYCNAELDTVSSTPANPEATPRPGDLTLCFTCANPLVFMEGLKVRKLDVEEHLRAMANVEVCKVMHSIARAKMRDTTVQ
jgi:uncharacterized protein with PIN domain